MKTNWKEIIGCSGWFNSEGELIVPVKLKTYKISSLDGHMSSPCFHVVDVKKDKVIITSDFLWLSEFPKKLTVCL